MQAGGLSGEICSWNQPGAGRRQSVRGPGQQVTSLAGGHYGDLGFSCQRNVGLLNVFKTVPMKNNIQK